MIILHNQGGLGEIISPSGVWGSAPKKQLNTYFFNKIFLKERLCVALSGILVIGLRFQ